MLMHFSSGTLFTDTVYYLDIENKSSNRSSESVFIFRSYSNLVSDSDSDSDLVPIH